MKPLTILLALAISGCAHMPQKKYVTLTSSFDDAAESQLKPGKSSIEGNAFINQNGGGVVTCAGREVSLIPVTKYAEERLHNIYGNTQKGFVPVYSIVEHKFDPDFIAYRTNMKTTKCDSQGNFSFPNLKPGTYFLTSVIIWSAGQYSQTGGMFFEKVELADKETKKVVFSP